LVFAAASLEKGGKDNLRDLSEKGADLFGNLASNLL
jgi:hypothetical protein